MVRSTGGCRYEEMCPCGQGQLVKILEMWVCQRPCGFQTRAADQVARVVFYQATKQALAVREMLHQVDEAIPGSNIIGEFEEFVRGL